MFKYFLFVILLLITDIGCKNKSKQKEEQILGTRFSKIDQYIFKEAGSKKNEDKVTLVNVLEEVTALEQINKDGKDYYRLQTVTKKEGYALVQNFSEANYFIIKSGLDAFKKPTLTAGTKGKIQAGAICFQKELQAEWSNVDCLSASFANDKLEDWYDIWIQYGDDKISKDPLLGETSIFIREGFKKLSKYKQSKEETERQSLILEAKKSFQKAKDKADSLQTFVEEQMTLYGMVEGNSNLIEKNEN
jgi:lipoprotein LenA